MVQVTKSIKIIHIDGHIYHGCCGARGSGNGIGRDLPTINDKSNGQQNGMKNIGHHPYFCSTTHMNMFDFCKSNSEKNWALFCKFISLIS